MADPDVKTVMDGIMSVAERQFKLASFTDEQIHIMADCPVPNGVDPGMDVRCNAIGMFIGFDKGTFGHVYRVLEDGLSIEEVLVHVENAINVDDKMVLVVRYFHYEGRATCPGKQANDFFEVAAASSTNKLTPTSRQVSRRELAVLCRLLEENRRMLAKKFVKYNERLWNPTRGTAWRVSVVAPLQPPAKGFGARSRERMKKQAGKSLSCEECGKTQEDADRAGQALLWCKGCMAVCYCSAPCQKRSWKGHKMKCRKLGPLNESHFGDDSPILRTGDMVEVFSLIGATHLNGSLGTLVGFCEDTTRWLVEMSGGIKKIKPSSLRQHVGTAQKQNYLIAAPRSVINEDPEHFAGVSSFSLPITSDYKQPLPDDWVQNLNGVVIVYNKLRRNTHGSKVFVVKQQLYPFERLGFQCMLPGVPRDLPIAILYDALREEGIMLQIWPAEPGERGAAHRRLEEMSNDRGGLVSGVRKIYLYAQREGAALRIFTNRLPPQAQPF